MRLYALVVTCFQTSPYGHKHGTFDSKVGLENHNSQIIESILLRGAKLDSFLDSPIRRQLPTLDLDAPIFESSYIESPVHPTGNSLTVQRFCNKNLSIIRGTADFVFLKLLKRGGELMH